MKRLFVLVVAIIFTCLCLISCTAKVNNEDLTRYTLLESQSDIMTSNSFSVKESYGLAFSKDEFHDFFVKNDIYDLLLTHFDGFDDYEDYFDDAYFENNYVYIIVKPRLIYAAHYYRIFKSEDNWAHNSYNITCVEVPQPDVDSVNQWNHVELSFVEIKEKPDKDMSYNLTKVITEKEFNEKNPIII